MKRIHIFRIILFSIIIIIPIITMNFKENQVSSIDNRNLTNFSDITNGDITNNIESYIEDRIGFRDTMITAYTLGMDKIFNDMVHPSYQYGENGYIYSKLERASFDEEFQEIFSDFIVKLQEYCNNNDIKFLYALEPSKITVYQEYLPIGYNYKNENLEYLLSLLEEKKINYIYNGEVLEKYKDTIQVFDEKYDANHWNETGAIIAISAILDRLHSLDSSVDPLDINKFEKYEVENTTLPVSYFPISEYTYKYNLIDNNSIEVDEYKDKIEISKQFRTFVHYRNLKNTDAPKILVFAGSYFNEKDKFLTESFSEYIKVHNYHNVINYEYYINLFNPDIILFESTEYTHKDHYFPVEQMKNKINS
ncbi:alginate O-acetyltransferase [Clostridium isatidis]|uniref:Alginate O-acetyltransferase n=1 Tax=Clostridium isatidis TaxID=182773 RepID=A0A343JA87_9CLOT|nr:alginate O-acetyltransferase [Clostridium isatidis]ASW42445.1 alginate O-acetyltransferase [Clostridium isatidis]